MKRLIDGIAGVMGRRPPALQVAALCTRLRKGRPQVLLITSRGTGRWVVPKGWPIRGRSLAGAAAQEAWEEAGIRGQISANSLGSYRYGKGLDGGLSIDVEVRVFHLRTQNVSEDYPECDERDREWFFCDKAAELVAEPGLKALIGAL